MNESNIFVRLLIALIVVGAAFVVIDVLAPLFPGVNPAFLNAIVVILKLAFFVAGAYYVLTGRRSLA